MIKIWPDAVDPRENVDRRILIAVGLAAGAPIRKSCLPAAANDGCGAMYRWATAWPAIDAPDPPDGPLIMPPDRLAAVPLAASPSGHRYLDLLPARVRTPCKRSVPWPQQCRRPAPCPARLHTGSEGWTAACREGGPRRTYGVHLLV